MHLHLYTSAYDKVHPPVLFKDIHGHRGANHVEAKDLTQVTFWFIVKAENDSTLPENFRENSTA